MMKYSLRQLGHAYRSVQPPRFFSSTSGLVPGKVFSISKRFDQQEVLAFLQATGDTNPVHVDVEAARAAGVNPLPSHPLLPGILMASLFPAIIGSHFPGAVYATQTLSFRAPAMVGDALVAHVTVSKCSGRRTTFATHCLHAQSGQVLVDGTALALMPK